VTDEDLIEALEGLGVGVIVDTGQDSWVEGQAHLIEPGVIAIYQLDPEEQPVLFRFDSVEKVGPAINLVRESSPPVLLFPLHESISQQIRDAAKNVQVSRDFALLQFSDVAEELG